MATSSANIYINIYRKYAVTDVDIFLLVSCCRSVVLSDFFLLLYFYFVPTKITTAAARVHSNDHSRALIQLKANTHI